MESAANAHHGCGLSRRDIEAAIVKESTALCKAAVAHTAGNRLLHRGEHGGGPAFEGHLADSVAATLEHEVRRTGRLDTARQRRAASSELYDSGTNQLRNESWEADHTAGEEGCDLACRRKVKDQGVRKCRSRRSVQDVAQLNNAMRIETSIHQRSIRVDRDVCNVLRDPEDLTEPRIMR